MKLGSPHRRDRLLHFRLLPARRLAFVDIGWHYRPCDVARVWRGSAINLGMLLAEPGQSRRCDRRRGVGVSPLLQLVAGTLDKRAARQRLDDNIELSTKVPLQ